MKNTEKIKEENSDLTETPEEEAKKRMKKVRKTQGQVIQEALGLGPTDIQNVEKKLFMVRFLDYFCEETLDFVFKDKTLNQYITQISTHIETFGAGSEEDRLLQQSFKSKKIVDIVNSLKEKAEEVAKEKGVKGSMDKRLRKLSLVVTLPLLGVVFLLLFLVPAIDIFLFPVLCIFCMLPQIMKGRIVKKWFSFKEENKNLIYSSCREDILILKGFAGETLDNIRSRLLDLNVPLQLIKFVLHSQDYQNLNLLNTKNIKGSMQYFYTFAYPQGVEPIPIPKALQQFNQPLFPKGKTSEKLERNFIVLTEMKGKEGVISSFVPTLKDKLADEINEMLNNSKFSKSEKTFKEIIPDYSEKLAIYCICGDIAEISIIQICNWKDRFTFYLFEGKECNCGESIYALSLMNETAEIPEELKDIFSS